MKRLGNEFISLTVVERVGGEKSMRKSEIIGDDEMSSVSVYYLALKQSWYDTI